MRRHSKAQLNAISRSYTEKGNREALKELEAMGIDFEEFRKASGFKASAVRLVQLIHSGSTATHEKLKRYQEQK